MLSRTELLVKEKEGEKTEKIYVYRNDEQSVYAKVRYDVLDKDGVYEMCGVVVTLLAKGKWKHNCKLDVWEHYECPEDDIFDGYTEVEQMTDFEKEVLKTLREEYRNGEKSFNKWFV